jgi:hypothetical protein
VFLPLSGLVAALVLGFSARAAELSTLHSQVRALGMGDAFTAVADDDSSLFYNPAGLAQVSGLNWKVFSARAGASSLSALKKIKDMKSKDEDGYADAIEDLYGEHIWSGAGGESIFTMPMVGFGVYNHTEAMIKVDNPVSPEISTRIINDYGYTAGLGIPLSPFLHVGAALKYVKRSGADVPFGASFVADLDPDDIYGQMTSWGKGYGADIGATIRMPTPVLDANLSVAWKNIGGMKFKTEGGGTATVPTEESDLTAGASLKLDLPLLSITPAIDVRGLNNADVQLIRKINFGIEIGLPLLDIRGGFHEGYYTAGAGVNLALFRVDAATYGVELGDYPGQIEDRRYMLQFTMQLGIGDFAASGSGKENKGTKSGTTGSGSRSFWGGSKRLKQRR